MNQKKSLFHHLAFNFSKSPEDLASEALCYILAQSNPARAAFIRFVQQAQPLLPDDIQFSTQESGEQGERPDLAGVDVEGKEVFLGEAKFWAGLTDNQPVAYIRRLKKRTGSMLIFIVPEIRIATIWPEVLRRCADRELKYEPSEADQELIQTAKFSDYPLLAIVSWRKIINCLRAAVEPEGDRVVLADIIQLEGLCERMDESAFLPLRAEELAGSFGMRLMQLNTVVDDVIQDLWKNKLISLDGVRATPTREGYDRYAYTNNFGLSLQINSNWWAQLRETPLWLTIQDREQGGKWTLSKRAKEKLVSLELEQPARLFFVNSIAVIPIYLPFGVERGEVMASILGQVNEIISLIEAG